MGADIWWQQPPRLNAAAALIDGNIERGRGECTLYLSGDRTVTYREFQGLVNRAGNALLGLGVEMEQRVAILSPDCPELAAVFFGAVKAGAVAVPLSTLLTPRDYVFLLNDSRARVLVVALPLLEKIRPVRTECKYLKHVVVLGAAGSDEESLPARMAATSDRLAPADTCEGDCAFWAYTSGTTGAPKAVMKNQYALANKATDTYHGIDVGEDDRFHSLAAMFTDFGIHNMVATLQLGASQVLSPHRPTPEGVLEILRRFRPTVFLTVPTMLARLLALPDATRTDFACLRLLKAGAEPLPADLYHRFKERFGVEALEMMGTSETSGEIVRSRAGRVKPGVLGEPVHGRELKVVGEDLRELPAGQIGRLMARDHAMASGYWNRPAATRKTFLGEWILTDDRFLKDEDGYFHHKGRADDIIDVAGRKVVPYEGEAALRSHPLVADAGIVGEKDADGLTALKAFVVLTAGTEASDGLVSELQEHVKKTVAAFNCPRRIEFVDSLPRNALGKLERYRLK